MNFRDAAFHVSIAILLGGLVAAFLPVKWLAASFWASATLFLVGSTAFLEDSLPGGFDNPDGKDDSELSTRFGFYGFLLRSLFFTAVLAGIGFYIQFY